MENPEAGRMPETIKNIMRMILLRSINGERVELREEIARKNAKEA
jgi:hypothetical protein